MVFDGIVADQLLQWTHRHIH